MGRCPRLTDSAGPVGPDGTLSLSDPAGVLFPAVPVGPDGSLSPSDFEYASPGGPVGTLPPCDNSPAEVLVGDCRDVVDMDVTVDSFHAVPDVFEDCAVVAMVGLDAIRTGEDTPMDGEGECAEWDIHNEFETINAMAVYYGGDLYDSDESEWEDPYNLAYPEYVDQYNFDAPEGMELKVFEQLQVPDESVTSWVW